MLSMVLRLAVVIRSRDLKRKESHRLDGNLAGLGPSCAALNVYYDKIANVHGTVQRAYHMLVLLVTCSANEVLHKKRKRPGEARQSELAVLLLPSEA